MKKLILFLSLFSAPLLADPSVLIIGDSTMRMNCNLPGWLPAYAECRAVGGWSYAGYLRELSWGPCRSVIVVGSAGLNAGFGSRPYSEITNEYAQFVGRLRAQCPGSEFVLIGINKNRLMREEVRQMFNDFAGAFADRYIEPPFDLDRVFDACHYDAKAAWLLRPLIFGGN